MRIVFFLVCLLPLYVHAAQLVIPGGTLDITYRVDSSWGTGFQAAITIKNNSNSILSNWNLSFTFSTIISSLWNGTLISKNGTKYNIGGPSWQKDLGAGQTAEIGFVADGVVSEPTIFALESASSTPNPENPPAPSTGIRLITLDADREVEQITIDQGARDIELSVANTTAPSLQLATNNSSVISFALITPTKIKVTGLKPGRASLRIQDSVTNVVRYVGIRVKNNDGTVPGLTSYIAIGSVSEDTPDHLTFWRSFENAAQNKRVDIRYIYINGGPFIGWRTWSNVDGGRAINYIRESKKLGIIPFFVYYNIPDGGESYYNDKVHIEDQAYMQAYFKDLKFFLDIVRTEGGNELVGIILEPDFIGYMMQNSNGTNPTAPHALLARTDAAYTSGVLTGQDPQFPNTLQGLVQAINYLIKKYAPNAMFGWQINLWASPGITTSIGAMGLMRKTDSAGIVEGRNAIQAEAAMIARYYHDAGIASHGAHFVSIDKYGLDAGISSPDSPAQSTWFWNADHWNNYLLFANSMHKVMQLPVFLWQMPVGRINTSLAINPYKLNGTFSALNNTSQHYEDSAPTFFLGDTFKPGTTTRLNYFSTNLSQDSSITKNSDKVTWSSHMQAAANNGIKAILFGAGVGDSTHGVGNPPPDGYWWITKVQEYYKNT